MDGEYDAALVKITWLLATFGEMGSARASMRKIEKLPAEVAAKLSVNTAFA
jgi:hypothetical protein